MPKYCAAYGCSNRASRDSTISFHRFPVKPNLLKKWTIAVRRVGFKPTAHSCLCSSHFSVDDYHPSARNIRKRLNPGAVPSIFVYSKKPNPPRRQRTMSARIDPIKPIRCDSNKDPTEVEELWPLSAMIKEEEIDYESHQMEDYGVLDNSSCATKDECTGTLSKWDGHCIKEEYGEIQVESKDEDEPLRDIDIAAMIPDVTIKEEPFPGTEEPTNKNQTIKQEPVC